MYDVLQTETNVYMDIIMDVWDLLSKNLVAGRNGGANERRLAVW